MRAWWIALSLLGVACSAEPRLRPSFDLDGDGLDELLVRQSWDGRVRRLSVEGELGTTVLETAFDETVVRVGDVNGDRRDDLAVRAPQARGEEVRVHLGRADGTADPTPFFVLETPGSLRNVKGAGDLDGDGLSDLIAVGFAEPSFVIYGDPSTPRVSEPLEFGGEVHTRIDLDGDGRMDLLSTDHDYEEDRDEHRVLMGGSDALLEVPAGGVMVGSIPDPNRPRRDLMVGAVLVSDGIFATGAGRWVGDGFVLVDLPIPGIPIGYGQILGDEEVDSLFRVVEFDAETCETTIGSPWRALGSVVEPGDGCGTVTIAVAGDLDGDDFDELLQWIWADDRSRGLRIHHGGSEALTLGASVLPTFEEAYQPLTDASLVAAGDLDADGHPDLLGFDGDCTVSVRGGPHALRAERLCDAPELQVYEFALPTAVGSQDERPGDEVLVPGVGLVSFGGGVLEVLPSPLGGFPSTGVGDVNADGFVDVLDGVLYAGGPTLLSDAPVVLDLGGAIASTKLGDVNGDGIDDVGVDQGIRFGGADIESRPNDVDLTPLAEDAFTIVGVGDRDGDGVADVAMVLPSGVTIVVSVVSGAPVELERASRVSRAVSDLDGDGRVELLEGSVLEMSSSGERLFLSEDTIDAGDLDGDGTSELIEVRAPRSVALRWNGTGFDEAAIERQVRAEEFVLAPVL